MVDRSSPDEFTTSLLNTRSMHTKDNWKLVLVSSDFYAEKEKVKISKYPIKHRTIKI
jgi:hypothetical protein